MNAHKGLAQTPNPTKRNTVQRDLVLGAVSSMNNHPTSAEVYDYVRTQHPSISRATVYRNLDVLALDGKILKVDIPQGATRYDKTLTPHYHAKCQQCGVVIDVEIPVLANLNSHIDNPCGFKVSSHHILFEGLCASCQS